MLSRAASMDPKTYLHHRSISNEIGAEVGHVLGEVSDITDQSSLEANLRFAQLVGSALGLKVVGWCVCV